MGYYATNPQAIHETIDGETIIIDLATGTYFSLQGSAPEIWNGLVRGESEEQILSQLASTAGAPGDVEPTVSAFFEQLEAEGLIAPRDEAPPAGAQPSPPSETQGGAPFQSPRLERFTDMTDIILLDPVHKVDAEGWPHAAPAAAEPI